jgi:hypothetical protein
MTLKPPATPNDQAPHSLLDALRGLIAQARQQVLRHVDQVQVQTCWQIGRHIVEFEQCGQARAGYGKRLLPQLGQVLAQEFGKGFDERNLRHMRAFFQCFPIWNAVRSELSWTHYRVLARVESEEARLWYMQEAAAQNWSTRALERQIGTLYYERLLLSQDKAAVEAEAQDNLAALPQSPRAFVRDPMTEQDQKQLGNTLWGIADQLRGAMNADDFRDYMLSFLFLRYLSDNYETAAQKELGPDYPKLEGGDRRTPLAVWYAQNPDDVPSLKSRCAARRIT